jgi:hypothetical protein
LYRYNAHLLSILTYQTYFPYRNLSVQAVPLLGLSGDCRIPPKKTRGLTSKKAPANASAFWDSGPKTPVGLHVFRQLPGRYIMRAD